MPAGDVQIVAMRDAHAEAVLAIYGEGIAEGNATFETDVPDWPQFRAGKLAGLAFVATDPDATVLGWVAASTTSSRPCYAGVIEHSVYVAADARGRGIARMLLQHLMRAASGYGVWTIQSAIFPENAASAAVHARAGFRTVGRRERIAQQYGQWRDTVLIEWRRPD